MGDAVQHGFNLASAGFGAEEAERSAVVEAVAVVAEPEEGGLTVAKDLFGEGDDAGDTDGALGLNGSISTP